MTTASDTRLAWSSRNRSAKPGKSGEVARDPAGTPERYLPVSTPRPRATRPDAEAERLSGGKDLSLRLPLHE